MKPVYRQIALAALLLNSRAARMRGIDRKLRRLGTLPTKKTTTIFKLEDALKKVVLKFREQSRRGECIIRTVYPHGILSNGLTRRVVNCSLPRSSLRTQRGLTFKYIHNETSPDSAPSTAIGPERLWILVKSTFLTSSLVGEFIQHQISKRGDKTNCCFRFVHLSNLSSRNV